MKYFRCICSLLLVFALLLTAFSSSVSAELLSVPDPTIINEIYVGDGSQNRSFTFTPNDNQIEKITYDSEFTYFYPDILINTRHTFEFQFYDDYGNTLVVIPKGNSVTLKLDRVAYSIYHEIALDTFDYSVHCSNAQFLIRYQDGSSEYIDNVTQTVDISNMYRSSFECTFTPKKNVTGFHLIVYNEIPCGRYQIYLGETDGTHEGYYVTVDEHTKTEGILGGIVDKITGLWDSITTGFLNMVSGISDLPQRIWGFISTGFTNTVNALSGLPQKIWEFISTGFTNTVDALSGLPQKIWEFISTGFTNTVNALSDTVDALSGLPQKIWDFISTGFTNTVNSIIELPRKIWDFISDGLKSLFIPGEEFFIDFKDDMDALLSKKFGAVYEVIHILGDSWDRIKANDQTNSIYLPETTIPLPQDSSFSFGGYDVLIVPNGFGFFVNIIKGFVGVLATILFVNGLRKKYEEVMGVEK